MKDTILSIDLSTQAPTVQEVRGREYIEYSGSDDYRNLYPQFLIDLYYSSSTNAAIINATAEMIAGEDLIIDEDSGNLDTYVKLKKFMAHVNGKESMHELVKKLAFDFKLQGGYAIHVVWNNARTEIAELYHVPCERVRAGRPNAMGVVDTYYISADWSNTRVNKPYPIKAFNVNDRTSPSQLLYTGSYSPNMDIYHTCDYQAGISWCLTDSKIASFHLNNINNSFSGSYLFSFNNGIPTEDERRQVEQSLAQKFQGSGNAGKVVISFSEDRNRAPEVTPLNSSDLDKQYLALQELLLTNICASHRVTSKTLMGIDSANGFSSNADELLNASNFYQNTVVRPFQHNILKTLKTLLEVNRIALPLEFVQLKPITIQFDSKTIREVTTTDEIRESIGLTPLEDEETVVEEAQEFSKVGAIDGLPVYSTKEEAEAQAEKMGCSGSHKHNLNGETVYMPCKNHEQITNLGKCECQKGPLEKFSNKTALEQWIEDCGEDTPDGYDLVHEEVVDGEHQDFNFEEELNSIANDKLELASTGTARPNSRSSQDGTNKSDNDFYKVRYVYTKDNFLKQEGETREFCKLMMKAGKIYRKEDILQLDKIAVNPGWGPRGANTYSIWLADQVDDCCNSLKNNKLELYKGGGNCHHFWLRRIYKTSLRGAKSKINSKQIISYTKARSEGFTIKRNDKLVARPPKRMENEGFLPN